jgi:hypothetical protein
MKYTLATINTRGEATQRVMAAKLTRLTHKIAIQLHLVAKSSTICNSRSRPPVRELLDTLSYSKRTGLCFVGFEQNWTIIKAFVMLGKGYAAQVKQGGTYFAFLLIPVVIFFGLV